MTFKLKDFFVKCRRFWVWIHLLDEYAFSFNLTFMKHTLSLEQNILTIKRAKIKNLEIFHIWGSKTLGHTTTWQKIHKHLAEIHLLHRNEQRKFGFTSYTTCIVCCTVVCVTVCDTIISIMSLGGHLPSPGYITFYAEGQYYQYYVPWRSWRTPT